MERNQLNGLCLIQQVTMCYCSAVNYDAENFRQKQRESAQTGLMRNAFGSWFGNITQNTQQDYAATGQKNRFNFYEQLTDFKKEDNPYDMSGWEYRFYDHQGKPLYLEEHQGKILFLDGEVAVYRAATEYLQTQEVCDRLVSNAERMFADYADGILGSTYQNYAY